ncbi:MAG: hypothetical protein ABI559_01845 [Chloroflexota bacterium]
MEVARRAASPGVALLLLLLTVGCGGSSSGTSTPTETPSAGAASASPNATPSATPTPAPVANDLPTRDLLDLAKRFNSYTGGDLARTTPFAYQIGDQETFTLVDLDTAKPYQITATVTAITDHAYFFVENGSAFVNNWPAQVSSDFEDIVWPTVTGAFGEPWTPGVDSDPRITVLNAALQGAAGYVSSIDEYPPAVSPDGNGREMVYIDSGAIGDPSYNGLISHELQHLVHYNGDHNEESWVNEGLSQVALEMGGGSSDSVYGFLGQPNTQLNFWPSTSDAAIHYGESELFFDYLLDHYGGRQNAKALVDEQPNGIAGVQAYLDQYGKQFDDVFADFVAANLLDLPGDGPYSHDTFDGTTTAVDEASATGDGSVAQYGTNYLTVSGSQGQTFRFQGESSVSIGIPNKDGAFWWSGRSDSIDSRLTREVDLSSVTSAALNFDAWYSIEDGWDYGYVDVSADGGATWKPLTGQHTTTKNPAGAAYGPGYTGESGGWVAETVDLSAYAGKKIQLRFELLNDDATNLTGFAVDNISIPAVGFADTADSTSGWTVEGFSQVTGPLAQTYIVQVIHEDGTVDHVDVGASGATSIPLGGSTVTIAISGATGETNELAKYSWSIVRTQA